MNTTSLNTPNSPPQLSLWRRLRHAWAAFMGRKPRSSHTPIFSVHAELVDIAPSPRSLQPYNPQALPTAREQWQRGDWASLAALTMDELQDHPDRAKLALLTGIGKLNIHQYEDSKKFIAFAKLWGLQQNLIDRLLISTTYLTISRAAEHAHNSEMRKRNKLISKSIVSIKNGR
jgi:hypothetical protein